MPKRPRCQTKIDEIEAEFERSKPRSGEVAPKNRSGSEEPEGLGWGKAEAGREDLAGPRADERKAGPELEKKKSPGNAEERDVEEVVVNDKGRCG